MGEARNFKIVTRIDLRKSHLNRDKIPPKGAILNFKPSSINLERVKLETSQFDIKINLGKFRLTRYKIPPKGI